ncbi:hypothetical protein KA977_11745, partial [Candidatus Dependentiae bacterium]|nr:hypothetical protein [Candidatus Dependentiae bacterium]
MKKKFNISLILFSFILLFSSCSNNDNKHSGDSLVYDNFRGDLSSIVNIVQYNSLLKCINQLDLKKYNEKKIFHIVTSPNEYVENKVNTILNQKYIENNIKIYNNSDKDGITDKIDTNILTTKDKFD